MDFQRVRGMWKGHLRLQIALAFVMLDAVLLLMHTRCQSRIALHSELGSYVCVES